MTKKKDGRSQTIKVDLLKSRVHKIKSQDTKGKLRENIKDKKTTIGGIQVQYTSIKRNSENWMNIITEI